jgi:hypothetical protein
MKRLAAIISGVAMLLTPAVANAACSQSNLTGVWQAYTAGVGGAVPAFNWVRCKIRIADTGAIANTTCTTMAGASVALTNGVATLTIPGTCTFVTQFEIAGALYHVKHATLGPTDKRIGNGVGTFQGGGFAFNMTRL